MNALRVSKSGASFSGLFKATITRYPRGPSVAGVIGTNICVEYLCLSSSLMGNGKTGVGWDRKTQTFAVAGGSLLSLVYAGLRRILGAAINSQ
jgi:hypothetical protein